MTRILAVILTLWAAALPIGSALGDEDPLASLLAQVAGAMGAEIAFREEHHGALYDEPAVYLGRLAYRAEDGALVKEIDSPEPARLTVTDRHVLMAAGGRERRLSLRGRPELQAMAGGFRALLAGDTAPLEGLFEAALDAGDDGHWRITLTPVPRRLAREVDSVVIAGHADRVDTIDTQLVNGDRQHLALLHDRSGDESGDG